MSRHCIVIVGAGQAGARAASALRAQGWPGRLVLIGEEAHTPYERPPLSKQALVTPGSAPTLVAEHGHYGTLGIELKLETCVRSIDLAAHSASVGDASGVSETLYYDKLLLATGGRARGLDVPGAEDPRVMTLRSAYDAARLSARLRPGHHVAVVGGGFIGLEVAASARQRGCMVSVFEAGPRLLGRAVPASLAEQVRSLHLTHGVDLRLVDMPVAFVAEADRIRINLASGTTTAVDSVVVGIGMTPETSLARAAGLEVRRGILVDETLRTSDPDVYAAGDVCEFPGGGGSSMVLESWANAEAQAERVARNMLGESGCYQPASWMWSDQYDHTLQMTGRCNDPTTRVATRALPGGRMEFYVDATGRVVGASGFAPTAVLAKPFAVARRLVDQRVERSAADLSDPGRPLKSLLAA